MNRHTLTYICTAVALAALSGCSLAPDYQRPAAPVPTAYQATGALSNSTPESDLRWQQLYSEPHLQRLIALALKYNRDLIVATLHVESARAQYQIQRSDLLPTLNATAGASIQRAPADLAVPSEPQVTHSYSVGGTVASYELDLFGRIHSLSVGALESWLATDAARKAAQITLVSEVVNAWLTLQADLQLKDLATRTLTSQQDSHKIVDAQYRAGTATTLDLVQADSQLHAAEVSVASAERAIRQDKNAIALLLGTSPPADCLTAVDPKSLRLNDDISPGAPSDLLTRRPDIVEAEHQLKSANANIGAARAAFFPRITLTASGGTASAALSNLFDAGSGAWSFGPSISVPIFDYERNRASLDVAKVTKHIEVANYEKAIQSAFRDVSDALDARETWARQEIAQRQLVDANTRAYTLAMERYTKGVDDYLNVLVSQRALFDSQQSLIKLELAREQNAVSLYRALGGGWDSVG
ncbi:efflux transporter outer membrane subunit [Paraburkholderia tropica]|uniref:efflux transporter outer membrane subunit n=1 Tax=Paraburkholderia tropica TaxID=92647 RepID=UPI002AB2AD23|nr:efflux transporter outer membrane subunit [Paraburkholderia tropica]